MRAKKKTQQAERRLADIDTDKLQRRLELAMTGLTAAIGGARTLLHATHAKPPRKRRRKRKLLGLAGLIAGGWYAATNADRQLAKELRDKAEKLRSGGSSSSSADGGSDSSRPSQGASGSNQSISDQTLTRKVESEIFRDPEAPKGSVSINAAGGVVYLRGEVSAPSWIERLGQQAEAVEGVRAVKNLLHLPGQEAPMLEEHLAKHTDQANGSGFSASGVGQPTGHPTDDRS